MNTVILLLPINKLFVKYISFNLYGVECLIPISKKTNFVGCQKSCDSTILQNISNSAVISSNKFETSKETMTSSQECTTNNSGIETKHEIEEERCDSRQSQRSLSPLSVGPIPVPPATQK